MTREELLADGTQYCCYCGCEKVRFHCCGENHFQTFAQMSTDEQDEFLDNEEKDVTSDEITKLIQDNGLTLHGDIEHFAALVEEHAYAKHNHLWLRRINEAVEAEREACAKVCDEIVARYRHADDSPEMVAANWCAAAIRARDSA